VQVELQPGDKITLVTRDAVVTCEVLLVRSRGSGDTHECDCNCLSCSCLTEVEAKYGFDQDRPDIPGSG
jgi:hypothetical protein